MNNVLDLELLTFLRNMVYANAAEYYQKLAPEKRSSLIKKLSEQNLLSWVYYKLNDVIDDTLREKVQPVYRKRSIQMLQNKVAVDEICKLFEAEKVRFALFKGSDLAYRCYPVPALRYMSDLDILIHPDDCRHALEVLGKNNWTTQAEVDLNTMHHHFVQHFKNGLCLEPHRTFAQFGKVPPRDLWQYITPAAPGKMQHVLSAELNLLQLTCHAASWLYNHLPMSKLLLDCAFLLQKESVDWEKLALMAKKWDLPYPGNLLSAYPEFFPSEQLELFNADTEAAAAYRELIECEFKREEFAPGEFDLNDERGSFLRGIRRALNRMSARAVRKKYSLPEQGCYCRLAIIWGWDLLRKVVIFGKYLFFPSRKMHRRRKLIKKAEALYREK